MIVNETDPLIDLAAEKACDILNLDYKRISDNISLLRVYFALNHLLGKDHILMKKWIDNYNSELKYIPSRKIYNQKEMNEILSHIEGLLFL